MGLGLFGSSWSSRNIAMDLGTANTLVYIPGEGIVIDEPSVVAVETIDGVRQVRAVGSEAKILIGKTPGQHPDLSPADGRRDRGSRNRRGDDQAFHLQGGRRAHSLMSRGPEIVICVPRAPPPSSAARSAPPPLNAGGRRGLVGRGADGGCNRRGAAGEGADRIDGRRHRRRDDRGRDHLARRAELRHFGAGRRRQDGRGDRGLCPRKHNVMIGESTAERIKKEIGSALVDERERSYPRLRSRPGRRRRVGHASLLYPGRYRRSASASLCLRSSRRFARRSKQAQPEIASDMIDRGITLTGGGSLLRNIDRVLADETGLPVKVADAPLHCVAVGAGRTLEDPEFREALCPA